MEIKSINIEQARRMLHDIKPKSIPLREDMEYEPERSIMLNGQDILFDGCSSDTLDNAVAFYPPVTWEYLGATTDGPFINGVKMPDGVLYHYFKRIR